MEITKLTTPPQSEPSAARIAIFDHLDKYNAVLELFRKESDRAAAILVASYLDGLLERLLRDKLTQDKIVDTLFDPQAALGTFSSRIKLCYALGLVSKESYYDLELVRKIRNDFAHNITEASFEDEKIRDKCSCFSLIRYISSAKMPKTSYTARESFMLGAGSLSLMTTMPVNKEWIIHSHTKKAK